MALFIDCVMQEPIKHRVLFDFINLNPEQSHGI